MWTSKTIALAAGMAAAMTGGLASGNYIVTSYKLTLSGGLVRGTGLQAYLLETTSPPIPDLFGQNSFASARFPEDPTPADVYAISAVEINKWYSPWHNVIQVNGSASTWSRFSSWWDPYAMTTVDMRVTSHGPLGFVLYARSDKSSSVNENYVRLYNVSTNTLLFEVKNNQQSRGVLPPGEYEIVAQANEGIFMFEIPSAGCLTTVGLGLALIAARRRRTQ